MEANHLWRFKHAKTAISGLRGENPEERNDEIDTQVGLEVVVRLAAAGCTDRIGADSGSRVISSVGVNICNACRCRNIILR